MGTQNAKEFIKLTKWTMLIVAYISLAMWLWR